MNYRYASLLLATTLGSFGCASQSGAGGPPSPYVTSTSTVNNSGGSYAPQSANEQTASAPAGAPSMDSARATGGASSGYIQPSVRAPSPPPPSPSAPPQSNSGPSTRVTSTVHVQMDGAGDDVPRRPSETSEAPAAMRQGLATEYGETRTSAVGYTSFTRASTQPFDTAAIYYNDANGVAAQASYRASQSPVMFAGAYHDGIRVSLRDESGRPLPGYMVNDRLYVMGTGGQRYTVLLENQTSVRVEAVVSVDGLDVINGRPAAMGFRGYIVPAHGQIAIDGFRQDAGHVAAFRLGSVGDSYAAQTGSARNVGVIGVALFSEYGVVLPPYDVQEVETRETANPFPGQYAPPPPRRYYQ